MNDQIYLRIAENIDKGIQTAPKTDGELSKAFIEFLKLVYTREEAELVQHLSMHQSKTIEEIIEAAKQKDKDVNVDKIMRAYNLAFEAHKDELRKVEHKLDHIKKKIKKVNHWKK